MKKDVLREVIGYGFLPRSFYGNVAGIGGEYIKDVKVYADNANSFKSYDFTSGDSAFLSTEDRSFPLVLKDLLLEMFPDPSPYEK